MYTPILGGGIYTPSDSDVNYNPLHGQQAWGTNPDAFYYQVMPCAGTLSNLLVTTQGSPGEAGKSFTVAVYKNGAATDLAVTISSGTIKGEDTSNEVSIAAGDRVCIRHTPTNTPTLYPPHWAVLFKAATANRGVLLGCSESGATGQLNDGRTEYASIATGGQRFGADPTYYYSVVPTDGTFKSARVYLSTAPDPGGSDGYIFTLVKNGEDTAITVTITGNSTTGSITTDVSFSAGDYLYWKISLSGTPSATPYASFGLEYAPTESDEAMILGSTYDPTHATNTEENTATGWSIFTWGTFYPPARDRENPLWNGTLRKLYWRLRTAPGAGNSYTLSIYKRTWGDDGGDDTGMTSTISGTDVSDSDSSNSAAVTDYDSIRMKLTPTSSPDTSWGVFWGFVLSAPGPYTTYPSDALSRISGLRHVYRPGSYRLEAIIGGVSNTVEIPQHERAKVEIPVTDRWRQEATPLITEIDVPKASASEVIKAMQAELEAMPELPKLRPIPENLWQWLTPWKEEEGETFGGEIIERAKSFGKWASEAWKGLFGK